MKSSNLYKSLAAITLALSISACGSQSEEAAPIAPEAPAGISVSDGRMTLPAVAGNPGAVYFTIKNDSDGQETIRSAHVAGAASAVMHETAEWNLQVDMQELIQVPLAPGEELVFAPGGKHIMAFELEEGLKAGGETEVTLSFVDGDKVSFMAEIRAPGDDGVGGE